MLWVAGSMLENPEILERCACLGYSALWLIVGVVDIEILERFACSDFWVWREIGRGGVTLWQRLGRGIVFDERRLD